MPLYITIPYLMFVNFYGETDPNFRNAFVDIGLATEAAYDKLGINIYP